jgi:hypothetical protein
VCYFNKSNSHETIPPSRRVFSKVFSIPFSPRHTLFPFIGSIDGKLYAVSTLDGTETWTYTTGGAIEGAPAISANGQTIFVGSADKKLHAILIRRIQFCVRGPDVTNSSAARRTLYSVLRMKR